MDSNVGKNGFTLAVFGGEMVAVAFELRYMVILSAVLIFADLWWGHSDTMKRYCEAKAKGDVAGMEKYKWHKSRALRRSANKAVDYITYLVLGAFIGLGITEPMNDFSHVYTAAIGLGVGCVAELASIIGHFCYVKFGIEVKVADVLKWLLLFLVNFLKAVFRIKSKELGDALEQTINEKEGAK